MTPHFLADGNGRTARLLFAADTITNLDDDLAPIFGLMMLKSEGSKPFHLAARCARAGDFTMYSTCFATCIQTATSRYGEHVRLVARSVLNADPPQVQIALAERLRAAIDLDLSGIHRARAMSIAL